VLDDLARRFSPQLPGITDWSLRLVERRDQAVRVRRDVLQPIRLQQSVGACITVRADTGIGYAATSDLTPSGLREATVRARDWADCNSQYGLLEPGAFPWPSGQGAYRTPVQQAWSTPALGDSIAQLQGLNRRLKCHAAIVHWEAGLAYRHSRTLITSSRGAAIDQAIDYLCPDLLVVATAGAETQQRTFGSDYVRQGGLEQLEAIGFNSAAERIAEDAVALLHAPDCPTGCQDLLLLPAQMVLQIHESIGHPLELDRILGDERNYAGGSFVSLDMLGRYQYGSALLNVSFDPGLPEQLASYAYDDDGTTAEHQVLIRDGLLLRALGGVSSQQRAGVEGVACARADNWNRPPIDRMANLNLEPGTSSFAELVASIERGVLMDSNRSWSIDDLRNKFQFGCEYGRLIEAGELKGLVKNPGYRGVSAEFWRNLAGVGDAESLRVMGLATCGKGEPNQIMQVGHAAPPCVFRAVEVFGAG
jgi:predicted Zn-dependent protease